MDYEKTWEKLSRLGAAEIIRRTAEASGIPREKIYKKVMKKRNKLAIVTDTHAAFLVAGELKVAEEIADGREMGDVCPECGATLKHKVGYDPLNERTFDGVECPNKCDLR